MRFLRELVHALVGVGVLGIMVHAWLLQGFAARVLVTSGSMAPHLLGPHRQWVCGHCGHSWECDQESLASVLELNCPRCGTACDVSEGIARPGDHVLIDRSAFLWRSPRRWEAVVFESPEEPGALGVKRVAGLPGESVQLRGGDVFINDTIARKSIAEQRDMAIGVYEMPEAARDEVLQRWRAEPAENWQFVAGRFVHRAPRASQPNSHAASTAPIDWLRYYHRQCFRSNEQPRPGPILDESCYDPSESRILCPVSDVILRCRITASPRGAIYVRAIAGGDEFTIEVDPERSEANLLHNHQAVFATKLPSGALGPRAQWEVVLADHQLLLAIDNRSVIEFRYQPIGGEPESQAPRVAIGARGAEVELGELQILRDIYYTTGSDASGESGGKYQLGPDEYFLLGDNSPHSLDSRVWSLQSGISARSIVGRAVKW